jgi:hypothetical protein
MYGRVLGSFLLLLTTLAPSARGDTITLTAVKDNTIFSESGSLSNGVGPDMYSGRILNPPETAPSRRALMAFDVSSLPTGVVIDSVRLELKLTKSPDLTPRLIRVYRVVADWGEGASDGQLGQGGPAQPGDATWVNTFYPNSLWSTPGGDVAAAASDSLTVVGPGDYVWTSAGLASDVHGWTSQTFANYGWMLIGDEIINRTVRQFSSREGATPPRLVIYYSAATPVQQTTWGKIKIRYR